MARRHEHVFALNAGGVDPNAVSRVDMAKMRIAGEHPVANVLPDVLGPMSLRPGTEHLADIPSDAMTNIRKFERSVGTSYLLLFSEYEMRVMLDGVIQQVPAVSTAIASGSWTDQSTSPATATGGATLTLNATSTASARLRQSVSVALADRSVTNVLRIVVSAGPVFLRVGTSAGGEEILADAELGVGTHKLGFTPGAATIYIEVRSDDPVERSVSQIQFESTLLGGTGDFVLPTPWPYYAARDRLRTYQSIDVMYCGDGVYQQRQIEHRGALSWGIALYRSNTGPMVYGSNRISLTPTARSGNTTVTASDPLFRSGHVGALLEMTSAGKTVTASMDALNQTSDYVTIIGIDTGRIFQRTGTGASFVGTLVLERSFDPVEPVSWTTYASYVDGAATFVSTDVDDGQDNITVHYRFRISAYTSGSVDVQLDYVSGVQVGMARITDYTNSTTVDVEVLVNFGNTNATRSWRIGDWSTVRGWPRTPIIHDGRLHWFRDDTDFASVVDDYTNFDDSTEGDSGPFTRSVGSGGEDGVLWAHSLDRLITGTASFEAIISASELDEALTPTSYTVRKPSRRGCANVQAVAHDDGLFFVQRSARKVYELSAQQGGARLKSTDVSRLNPAAYRPNVRRIVVQQQPNTRLYAVLYDGTVAILTYEREDEVAAITTLSITSATIEDVEVLPDTDQDDVYFVVWRGTQRTIERLAKEHEQTDTDTCALLDSHGVLEGSISSLSGITRFASQTVKIWADGQRRADLTLDASGNGSLGATYSRVVYGKSYTGVFKSVKLAHAASLGTAIGQTKKVHGAGLVLSNSCLDGIRVGRDASNTDPMPDIVNGAARTENQFFTHYDMDIMPINSDWNPDARVYLSIDSSEGPVTVQSIVLDIETRDGAAPSN